ncbi:MAG: type II toxin-antitoxin system death-on-curing family toxin [Gammaproteobacteria bacterium]|nr:MAG: type II toxin-antitoxin system death-on-curing family toxin [Gammaproteobacteria bacterium]
MARWIPESAIRAIHGELLLEHGGLSGPINEDMLGASPARPQHLGNPGPTLYQLAAAYGFGFAKNHCFNDGNKRVALATIDVFLMLNGQELVAEETDAALTIESLAAGELSEDELASWIEANTE